MKKPVVRILVKYAIAIAIGAGMAFAVLGLRGWSTAATETERIRCLADAFTVPGVILSLVAVLVWLGNEGSFLGITYLGSRIVRALVPMGKTFERHETYRDYVARKREKGGVKGYAFLLWVGLAFLAVAVVFTVLFYR